MERRERHCKPEEEPVIGHGDRKRLYELRAHIWMHAAERCSAEEWGTLGQTLLHPAKEAGLDPEGSKDPASVGQ